MKDFGVLDGIEGKQDSSFPNFMHLLHGISSSHLFLLLLHGMHADDTLLIKFNRLMHGLTC